MTASHRPAFASDHVTIAVVTTYAESSTYCYSKIPVSYENTVRSIADKWDC